MPPIDTGLGWTIAGVVLTVTFGIVGLVMLRGRGGADGALLDAARKQHFEDLLDLARALQQTANRPRPSGLHTTDARTGMLLEALRSHIPDSPLWGACNEWELLSEDLAQMEMYVEDDIRKGVEAAFETTTTTAALNPRGFRDSLWFVAHQTPTDESLDYMDWDERMAYQTEKEADGFSFKWGAYCLAKGDTSSDFEKVREIHQRLVDEIAAADAVGYLDSTLRRWGEARAIINREVEVLLLRHLLPGHCNICPSKAP